MSEKKKYVVTVTARGQGSLVFDPIYLDSEQYDNLIDKLTTWTTLTGTIGSNLIII